MRYFLFLLFFASFFACEEPTPDATTSTYSKLTGACEPEALLDGWAFTAVPIAADWLPAAFAFADDQYGVLVGDRGQIWRTENGGADWQATSADRLPADWRSASFQIVDLPVREAIFVVSRGRDRFLRSLDRGSSFEPVSVVPEVVGIGGAAFLSPTNYVLSVSWSTPTGNERRLLETSNGGSSWETLALPPGVTHTTGDFQTRNGATYLLGRDTSSYEVLLRYVPTAGLQVVEPFWDGWTKHGIEQVQVLDPSTVVAYLEWNSVSIVVEPIDHLFLSSDRGNDWRELFALDPGRFVRLLFVSPQEGLVLTVDRRSGEEAYKIAHTDDGGGRWTLRAHPLSCELEAAVYTSPSATRFLAARRGEVGLYTKE